MMLKNVIEYFLPSLIGADSEYLRRVRLVTYTVFISSIFALFYLSVSLLSTFYMGAVLMTGCFIGFFAVLISVRKGLDVFVAANLFGFVGSLSIYGCIHYSGGIYSPVFPWLAETPIIILLIAGKRSGYFWTLVSLGMMAILGITTYNGIVYPKSYDPSREKFFFLCCNIGLVLIIFLTAIVFENMRMRFFKEITQKKDELETTLTELKSTQSQLIQSEKMASLGELTAGIAHEIQNPLNFVNNFSEVSSELLVEIKEAVDKDDKEEIAEIATMLSENLEKINFHGKRADSIVKGMLQHSRKSTGVKELTDINELADEFLRLSYHGLRAKNKEFNATLKTDFGEDVGKLMVAPQDLGRVLLNIFNNAFYAVNEKKKLGIENFEPTVQISTLRINGAVQITIRDNGTGIPTHVLDKIYNPFFTTKPTGEGTGLGLSLTYDIITSGHGGEINVHTVENEFTEFVITLPME